MRHYCFTFDKKGNVRIHISAGSKFIAKTIMRTMFSNLWANSFTEDEEYFV